MPFQTRVSVRTGAFDERANVAFHHSIAEDGVPFFFWSSFLFSFFFLFLNNRWDVRDDIMVILQLDWG